MDLEEEVSFETNRIEEPKLKTNTDAGSNLSERDKGKKRADELSKIYKSKVSFPSVLEADSFHKKQRACNELSDILLVPIASDSTPNPKT